MTEPLPRRPRSTVMPQTGPILPYPKSIWATNSGGREIYRTGCRFSWDENNPHRHQSPAPKNRPSTMSVQSQAIGPLCRFGFRTAVGKAGFSKFPPPMCLFLRKSSGQGPRLAFGKSARLGPKSRAKNSQQRRGFQTGLRKQRATSQVSRKKPRGPEHTPRIVVGFSFGRSGSPIWQLCLTWLQIESRTTTPPQFKTKTALYSVRIRDPL